MNITIGQLAIKVWWLIVKCLAIIVSLYFLLEGAYHTRCWIAERVIKTASVTDEYVRYGCLKYFDRRLKETALRMSREAGVGIGGAEEDIPTPLPTKASKVAVKVR